MTKSVLGAASEMSFQYLAMALGGRWKAYRGEGHYKLVLSPGDFLVVFPGDAHRIKTQVDGPQEVAKAVFKVKIH